MKSVIIDSIVAEPAQLNRDMDPPLWWRRFTTRRQLARLMQQDPARVRIDPGLDEDAVRLECAKWFWQP